VDYSKILNTAMAYDIVRETAAALTSLTGINVVLWNNLHAFVHLVY